MPKKQENGDHRERGATERRPQRTSSEVSWPARRLGPQPERLGEREPPRLLNASGEDHIADASDAGSGGQDLRVESTRSADPPQPAPRDYSGGGKPIGPKDADNGMVQAISPQEHQESDDDATGGDAWNRVLGDTTNAGMLRLLGGVGLFILVAGALFWLVA
ncbi:hypothetical protein [Ensifer sp. BR816]|uniref:hypothetical protein n=1 Tax=Rhizobium sp. (strain BR816) TaxID=1057002 RepID=UPI0012FCE93C|nr:hypothetical protein [Ensifer sp. BR816]